MSKASKSVMYMKHDELPDKTLELSLYHYE